MAIQRGMKEILAKLLVTIHLASLSTALIFLNSCSKGGSDTSTPPPASPTPDPEPTDPTDPGDDPGSDDDPAPPTNQPPSSGNCRKYPGEFEMRKTYLSQVKKAETYSNSCEFDEADLIFVCTEAKLIDGSPGMSLFRRWYYENTQVFLDDPNFFKAYQFIDTDGTIYLNILDFDSSRLISYYKFDDDEDLERVGRVVERNGADLPLLIEEEDPTDPLCDDTVTYQYTEDLRIDRRVNTRRVDDGGGGCDTIHEIRLEYRYLESGFLDRVLETIVTYDPVTEESTIEINRYNYFYESAEEYCE